MTPDRWQKIEDVFQAALSLDGAERVTFVTQECGNDEELRREVEALLAFENTDECFLDSSPESLIAEMFTEEDAGMRLDGIEIGRYKVKHLLGKGGMGEVYLAEDTKLRRKVALKVLPQQLSADNERKKRFEIEARAVSALNHPNIITIYEIEEAENVSFMATEFIDGQTLRERLAENPFLWSEAVKIAIQIAEALESAHSVGIIHRDIKPANIMIRHDGIVKVLDFGLAKLTATDSDNSETREQTAPNRVMGTINYMSPEQALGEKIDTRTDIFSFGVVLYEMLTGISPFAGVSDAAVYNATINKILPSVSGLNDKIPPALDFIVKRALEKDRETRYQTMRELLYDLRNSGQMVGFQNKSARPAVPNRQDVQTNIFNSATGDLPLAATTAENIISPIKRYNKFAPLLLVFLVIGIGGLIFTGYEFWNKSEKSIRTLSIERLTTNGKTSDAAISPDGKYVVYVVNEDGKSSLWTRQVATTSNLQIIAPTEAQYFGIGFSPDGNYVNFVRQEKSNEVSAVYQMPVLGGEQKKLISDIYGAPSYSPNGRQLAFVRGRYPNSDENSLLIANVDGTNEKVIASLKNPESFRTQGGYPVWSSDGKTIACIVRNIAVNGWNFVEVQVADGKIRPTATKAWESIKRIAWLPY